MKIQNIFFFFLRSFSRRKHGINAQFKQNITSSYNSRISYFADYKGYVDFLFIQTLASIYHPLFMKYAEATAKFKLARYYDFNSVDDLTHGILFNNKFQGKFC